MLSNSIVCNYAVAGNMRGASIYSQVTISLHHPQSRYIPSLLQIYSWTSKRILSHLRHILDINEKKTSITDGNISILNPRSPQIFSGTVWRIFELRAQRVQLARPPQPVLTHSAAGLPRNRPVDQQDDLWSFCVVENVSPLPRDDDKRDMAQ